MLIILLNVSLCVLNGMSVALIYFNINTLSLSYQFLVYSEGMDSHTFCCNFESCDHRRETSVFSVPVDINDNSGCTPLWFAARDGDVCCVDVLLKHGASPQHER